MKKNFTNLFWLGIVLTTLISFGCGGSSNSGTVTVAGDATVAPFGAETMSMPMDLDGNGTLDTWLTTTYDYDSLGRMIKQTTTIENDNDEDGTVDAKSVYTTTYDPDIQISDQKLSTVTALAVSKVSGPSLGVGNSVATSYIEEDFELYSNNVLAVTYRTTSTYTYDTKGRKLSDIRVTESDTNADQIMDRIVTYSYTWSYNANDDLLENTYNSSTDADADGTPESCSSNATTYTYDDAGNEIVYHEESSNSCDGTPSSTVDISTINTYDLVTGALTNVEEKLGADTICATVFTYSGDLLSQKVKSCDSDFNGSLNERETTTYGYDGSNRMDSKTIKTDWFDNTSDTVTSIQQYSYTYSYDSQDRVITETVEDKHDNSVPADLSQPNYIYTTTYTYGYDTANRPISYTKVRVDDNSGSGGIDAESASGDIYTYDAGHGQLTGITSWQDFENDLTIDSENTVTLSYDSTGRLISRVYTIRNAFTDEITTRSGTYEETTGRVSSYVIETDTDANGTADRTDTMTFTYDGLVATIANVSTSGPSGSIEVSFGANGIPTGTTDMAFDYFSYPTPSVDDGERVLNRIEITAPIPNLLYLFEGNQNNIK